MLRDKLQGDHSQGLIGHNETFLIELTWSLQGAILGFYGMGLYMTKVALAPYHIGAVLSVFMLMNNEWKITEAFAVKLAMENSDNGEPMI